MNSSIIWVISRKADQNNLFCQHLIYPFCLHKGRSVFILLDQTLKLWQTFWVNLFCSIIFGNYYNLLQFWMLEATTWCLGGLGKRKSPIDLGWFSLPLPGLYICTKKLRDHYFKQYVLHILPLKNGCWLPLDERFIDGTVLKKVIFFNMSSILHPI